MVRPIDSVLDVITVVSNPCRYESRYRLFREFEHRILSTPGTRLTVVECAYGERPYEVTEAGNPRHIQVRTTHELWYKENLINIGVSRIPDFRNLAWIDADVMFVRPDWVQETIQQLQHYSVVQMFSKAQDLGPTYEPFDTYLGHMYCYCTGVKAIQVDPYTWKAADWHPGYAWAIRREAYDAVGGLIDWAILGAADRHMAAGLIGRMEKTIDPKLHSRYGESLLVWQDRAERYILRNVGYVSGLLLHFWHGKKTDRRYVDRWKILVDNQYDPQIDLKRDAYGLWQLTDRSIKLRDDLRMYFRQRNEDSIDFDH